MSLKNVNDKLIREFYGDETIERVFQKNELSGFDALWNLEAPWFEAPNKRRGGLSGVVTWNMTGPDGKNWPVFIKRQQNHNTYTFAHPLKGIPTFYREYKNVARLIDIGVPTIEALYYGEHSSPEGTKAILVSRALEGYISLENWFNSPEKKDESLVAAVLDQIVAAVKPMHQHGIRHGCLHGKHVMLKFRDSVERSAKDDPVVDVRLIDLEKARVCLFKNKIIEKDLSQLIRYSGDNFRSQATDLLLRYFDVENQRYWLNRIEKQIRRKSHSKG